MKFLLVIPDGVSGRNFLCTPFIDMLSRSGEVTIWHFLPEEGLCRHKTLSRPGMRWERLPYFTEGACERILLKAKIFAQLYWHSGDGSSEVILRRSHVSGSVPSYLIYACARILGKFFGNRKGVVWIDRQHARAVLRAGYMKDFERFISAERPDAVFCPNQRSGRAVPAMLAAAKSGIPTATFIHSWDNLSKGRMAVHADFFLVWSEHMKKELLGYYPELEPDKALVVGTPQFEPYFDRFLIEPREKFLKKLGLDPARPVICFSGDNVTTSPHDQEYLADLASAMRDITPEKRPQILFRRCPTDKSERYKKIIDAFPEIAVLDPAWIMHDSGDWMQIVPTLEDTPLLVNTVCHCDAVINIGSTMAMDFAILDKPGIYLAYRARSCKKGQGDVRDLYRLSHLKSVHELQPVYWVDSPEKLKDVVLAALANPKDKSSRRKAWLEQQVAHPLDQASRRCCEALLKIAGGRPN